MQSHRYQDVPGIDKIGWDNDPEGYYKIVSSVAYHWDKTQVYFFANPGERRADARVRLRGKVRPEAWDPHTGQFAVPQFSHPVEHGQTRDCGEAGAGPRALPLLHREIAGGKPTGRRRFAEGVSSLGRTA